MDHAVHERTPRNESFPNCCHHVVIQDCKPLTTPKRLPLRYGVSPMTVDAETIKWEIAWTQCREPRRNLW